MNLDFYLWLMALAEPVTLVSALLAAVSALAGVIGILALWFKAQFNAISAKLNDCEEDREELWEALVNHGIRRPVHPARHPRAPRKRTIEEEEEGE